MKAKKEALIAWLNDAHAMEISLVENLKGKAKDAENAGKAEVKARIDEHIEETRQHAELVEKCIKDLGSKLSKSKDIMGKLMGSVQGAVNSMYKDTMVKNALESYSVEHFEIAAYSSIFAAAKELGEEQVVEVSSKIIQDEMKMAEWAMEQVSLSTAEYLETLE